MTKSVSSFVCGITFTVIDKMKG